VGGVNVVESLDWFRTHVVLYAVRLLRCPPRCVNVHVMLEQLGNSAYLGR
jgi:hypothetical protein